MSELVKGVTVNGWAYILIDSWDIEKNRIRPRVFSPDVCSGHIETTGYRNILKNPVRIDLK